MKNKTIYWMALFSLVLSIVTIILFFFKVKDYSVVNSDTFVSSCTAIITIGVTLAVGFQVFQSLDIKSKVNEIAQLKSELKEARKDFDLLTADLKSTLLYNESDRKWNEGDVFDAVLKLQEAIDVYLRSELRKDVVMSWMEILRTYVLGINQRKEHENKELDILMIDNFNLIWNHNSLSLKSNPNFWAIAKSYKSINDEVISQIKKLKNA